jgi:hypothetical protein
MIERMIGEVTDFRIYDFGSRPPVTGFISWEMDMLEDPLEQVE